MKLCLISATDSYHVTLSRASVLASPLESALPRNATAKRLESALAKSLDLKSSEINTYRKCGGGPPYFCLLQSLFANRCSSVFICGYTSCLFLPASFTSFALFTGHDYQLPLCNCQRWVAEAARSWRGTLQIGRKRQGDGGVQARLHRCAIMLWAM